MAKEKKSFFERLTGTVRMDETNEEMETSDRKPSSIMANSNNWDEEKEREGELGVDVFQTQDMIIVKAMLAGVKNEDLDISITRDMITIRGKREEERTAKDDDYFIRELYWGSFSRTITLPEEIDVDEAEAIEKHGLLILKLPKLDKKRQSKLKVKTI